MLDTAAFCRALRKIEDDLAVMVKDSEQPIDRHDLYIQLVRLGCQTEILERGLVEC